MKGVLTIIAFTMILAGCGNNITGSNTDLNVAHVGGKDCAQSGCHAGIGAAGTVFTDMSSETPVSGVQIDAINTADNSRIVIGTSNTLGNFSYNASLSGNFKFVVGGNTGGNVLLHKMPEFNGCNRCHRRPGQEGAPGKIY